MYVIQREGDSQHASRIGREPLSCLLEIVVVVVLVVAIDRIRWFDRRLADEMIDTRWTQVQLIDVFRHEIQRRQMPVEEMIPSIVRLLYALERLVTRRTSTKPTGIEH